MSVANLSNKTPAVAAQEQAIIQLVNKAHQRSRGDGYSGKRHKSRYHALLQLEVAVGSSADGPIVPANLDNVSYTGIAFWSRQELDAETDVMIREFTGHGGAEWVLAQVVHCTRGIRGYLIGASFHHPAKAYEPKTESPVRVTPMPYEPRERHGALSGLLSWLGLNT